MASCELRRIVWIGGVAGAYYLEVPRSGGRRVFALQIAPQGATAPNKLKKSDDSGIPRGNSEIS